MTSTSERKESLHVAIIMDGNGRWALARGLPRSEGHRAGASALRAIVEAAPALSISTLTLFALSSDNWKRPCGELSALMSLLRLYLRREAAAPIQNGARLVVIGRLERLPQGLRAAIRDVERASERGTRLRVRVAIDYSSRDAILRAAAASSLPSVSREELALAISAPASGERPGSPGDSEVDLLIRTGGEKRLSDFLLWESAYAELFFSDLMWPDFRPEHLRRTVEEFRRRNRRFGGLSSPASAASMFARSKQ